MSILLISFSSKSTAPKAVLGAIEQQQRILELDENEKAIFGLKRWDWTIDEKQVLSYGKGFLYSLAYVKTDTIKYRQQ